MTRQLLVVLCVVLFSCTCFGQCHKVHPVGDHWIWDVAYIESAAIGTLYINHIIKLSYWQSYLISVCFSLLKELGDEMYKHGWFGTPRSDHWFLDKRGGEFSDVGMAAMSIAISFPIRRRKK